MLMQIAQRPTDTDPTHVTGADVSRFQRRSVPRFTANQGATSAAADMSAAVVAAAASQAGGEPVITGPSVRVARGNTVTVVPVGGNR